LLKLLGWKKRLMTKKLAGAIVGLMLLGSVPQASATTILDTTNGAIYGSVNFYPLSSEPYISAALPFVSATAATITDIGVYIGSEGGGVVDIGIMADSGGLPSAGLPSIVFLYDRVVPLIANSGFNLSSLNWSISAGSYWLVAIALTIPAPDPLQPDLQTYTNWYFAPDSYGPFAYSDNIGNWTPISQPLPAAVISGDVPAVPLPAAMPLFASGLGALGLLGWCSKRKRKPTA
jgi:hypothetical protein